MIVTSLLPAIGCLSICFIEAKPPAETQPADQVNVIVGKVVAIADGDILTVLDGKRGQHRIRLSGIDAPERKQAFGTKSRQALSKKVFGKEVRIGDWRACYPPISTGPAEQPRGRS